MRCAAAQSLRRCRPGSAALRRALASTSPHEDEMDADMPTQQKPRLLFLRSGTDIDVRPQFIRTHRDEHRRCLTQFFDVFLVEEDCDYGELCERHHPDLAMFESGVHAR